MKVEVLDYGKAGAEYRLRSRKGLLLHFLILESGARVTLFRKYADGSYPKFSYVENFTHRSGFSDAFWTEERIAAMNNILDRIEERLP